MAALQADLLIPATACTSGTAKTVAGLKTAAQQAIKILEFGISFNGSTSTVAPATVEVCRLTWATNPPGTASTSTTPIKRDPARPETIQTTGGTNWTTEPTVITPNKTKYVGSFNGLYHYILPFASPEIVAGFTALAGGWCARITMQESQSCSGHVTYEE